MRLIATIALLFPATFGVAAPGSKYRTEEPFAAPL